MRVILYRDGKGDYGWVTLSHGIPRGWAEEPGFEEIAVLDSEDEAREYCHLQNYPINPVQKYRRGGTDERA